MTCVAPTDDLPLQARRYAASHCGKALLWVAGDTFTLFYLTDVVRLPAWQTAWFFLALLLWSAATDIATGWACDRWGPSDDATRGLIRGASLVAAASFAAGFAVPSGALAWPWLVIASVLFRTAYSVLDVPHNAWLARLAAAGADSMRLSSLRLALTVVVTIVVTTGAPLLLVHDGAAARSAFAGFAGMVALVALAGLFAGLPRFGTASALLGDGPEPIANGWRLLPLFAVAMIGTMLASLFLKASVYVAADAPAHGGWTSRALMLATVGKLLGSGLWTTLLGSRISPLGADRIACALIATVALLLAVGPDDGAWQAVGTVLLGIALAGATIAPWALLSDRMAGRGSALWFGLFTAAAKIGLGLSGWLLAMLIVWLERTSPDGRHGGGLLPASAGLLAGGALLSLVLLASLRSAPGGSSGRGKRRIGKPWLPRLHPPGKATQP